MRFNYQTFPILKYLDAPRSANKMVEYVQLRESFYSDAFSKKIVDLSKKDPKRIKDSHSGIYTTFSKAKEIGNHFYFSKKAIQYLEQDAILDKMLDLSCELSDKEIAGVHFFGKGGYNVYWYWTAIDDNGKEVSVFQCLLCDQRGIVAFKVMELYPDFFKSVGFYENISIFNHGSSDDIGVFRHSILTLGAITFLEFADVETKEMLGIQTTPKDNSSRKIAVENEIHTSESKTKVRIIDSSYFTTIIRSEGFGVRGHLRLQPHGEGMSKRKLIWISPFEKKGYTRIAKIQNQ